ncbi:MAG: DUF2058 family protein [Lysobacteraceae bacterium]|nr:MAG: DUF2058 family protein [Xanthomonadaceae bacterium]
MSDTLRDQLLGLGFKPAPKPERKPDRNPRTPEAAGRKPAPARPHGQRDRNQPVRAGDAAGKNGPRKGAPRTREDIDLAKAYAIRAQREKDERIEAERLKQEEARRRRESKAALALFLAGKGLNSAEAEHARHFEYGGKIKRIHVTADQLKALNAGELGVVQMDGRYLLVDAATLEEAGKIFAPAVALRVDPDAPAADDPYSDPQYQVPDDLVW